MLRSIAALLLLATSLCHAQSKVGTTGAHFLNMSPSVRSNGMGEAGVALTDNESFYFNPASLGFVDEHRVSLLGYPAAAQFGNEPDEMTFRSYSVLIHWLRGSVLDDNPLALSVALQRVSLSSDFWEYTYVGPGTGRRFTANSRAYSVSAGASYTWSVQAGLGVTARWLHQDVVGYASDGVAFDLGAMVRAPLAGTLDQRADPDRLNAGVTLGVTYSHYGPDLKFIEKAYSLPNTRRVGMAADLRYRGWSSVVSVEVQDEVIKDFTRSKLGLEVGFCDALWGRVGHVSLDDDAGGYNTYGGTISLRGLLDLASGHDARDERQNLFDRLDLRASYATSNSTGDFLLDGPDYFMFELVL